MEIGFMSDPTSPRLDAPGAGLPLPELLIARIRFALKCRRGTRESFLANFQQERERIRERVDSLPESQRGRQVLIKRLRGLEDSSRNWSAWMTLDHLRITNHAFADFIATLVREETPGRKADTAAVKPDPGVAIGIEEDFESSCEALLEAAGKADDLKTKAKHSHPWFGPLDAFQWLGLASVHMVIHRAQIDRIIEGQ